MRYTLLFLSLLVLSSCLPIKNTQLETSNNNTKEKQIIFFSDENNAKDESNYYDALLELKTKYPREISKMKIVSLRDNNKYSDQIKELPSLIIVKNNKILTKIEGSVEVEEIIIPIDEILSN